jgi:CRISPR-associated protein Csb1
MERIVEDLLRPDGPSALVLREELEPVGGRDAVFFPPTFAGGGYLINEINQPGLKNCVIVDTVESQANRLEQIFKDTELVPKVKLSIQGKISIDLLDLGHRVADALARFSDGRKEIDDALKCLAKGDAGPIAKISPTSLIFGFWDSRGTGVKWPRILRSEILAYNVKELRRRGQYVAPLTREFKPEEEWRIYTEQVNELKEFLEKDLRGDEKKFKDFLSEMGLGSVRFPKEGTELYGGCVLLGDGKIYRDAVLHLVALRALACKGSDDKVNPEKSGLLKAYILALSLVALTYPQDYSLREGCLLVRKTSKLQAVYKDGKVEPLNLDYGEIKKFAEETAKKFKREFGVGDQTWEVNFKGAIEEWKERQRKKGKKKEEEE